MEVAVHDVDEHTKLLIDLLYQEVQRVQKTSATIDEWLFRFLSIGILPFLAFLAYTLGNPAYQTFIVALPVLSLLGLVIVSQVMLGYLYVATYMQYLEARLRQLLGTSDICNERFASAVHGGWASPVKISSALGIFLLLVVNIAAVPGITATTKRLAAALSPRYYLAEVLLDHYWFAFCVLLVAFVTAMAFSWRDIPRRLRIAQRDQWQDLSRDMQISPE